MAARIYVVAAFAAVGLFACTGGGGTIDQSSGTPTSATESSGNKGEGSPNASSGDIGNVTPTSPADAGSGDSGKQCTPGAFVFCRCPDSSESTKRCSDDGLSFAPCACDGG